MNLYIILILLAVGSDYALGAVSETGREFSSRVVSDGPCIHEPSSNQIDRDIINPLESDGQRLSSTASASRIHPSTRLEDPQTLQVVIEHPEEKPSNEASSKSHTTQLQQFATSSIDTKKKQPVHHQVIDIKDPSTRVSSQAQEYKKCAYCGEDLEISKDTPNLHYCTKCEQNLRLIWAKERLTKDGRCMLCQGGGKIPSAQSAVGNQLRSSDVRRTPPAGTQDEIPTRQGRSAVVRNDEGFSSALAQVDSQDVKSRRCCLFVISAYLACTVAFVLCVLFLRKHGVQ
ncbi:hypothetical protein MJO28_003945 [Puccinia striiformis f. sp. tritici]|uniref:Uncharacterized protein n=1 Tax=Puccinia striiformis f. sp. tritici TaxID=168172 RepID=A0ACC0EN19_9BASI|nr:hypothetical protein Pst134EB_008561 [Puccinia striiformis f. sp. tritici]KAI7933874.1 hypothetical protein MJO28_017436 [Puccinia striiformis f. sp. tritici]KAI7956850.1 hypothetical protein MJO28_003945 [Puccinia striiformis f. sp. tritici]KAI7963956.1 hypothetical protein MJO29_004383 [Puccinia striiformis f. sp. tritici]